MEGYDSRLTKYCRRGSITESPPIADLIVPCEPWLLCYGWKILPGSARAGLRPAEDSPRLQTLCCRVGKQMNPVQSSSLSFVLLRNSEGTEDALS